MKLKIKFLNWSAGLPVAMLNKKTADKIGVYSKDRILLKTLGNEPRETSTILDTVEGVVKENEISVSSELKKILNLRDGQNIEISLASPPKADLHIRKKLEGKVLGKEEIDEIIEEIVNNSLSEAEISLFISALHTKGMNALETVNLINAFLKTGNKFNLKNTSVVNKHCIGGIPGNKTTPIIVSICAEAGLIFPKTSSRAITSEAGTADFMEAICEIDFSTKELKQILKKAGGFIVWGGGMGLVPADSKIIRIEKVLNVDAEPLLLSSILSKKIAVGTDYLLIDIPYGKNAKMSKKTARNLSKKFKKLEKYFDFKLEVVLTKGDQPIGRGVGPILELKDILDILNPLKEGPLDLEEKSLFLSGKILEMTGKAKKGKGKEVAREILYSGKAFERFKKIVNAQRGSLEIKEPLIYKKNIYSLKSGKVRGIDKKTIICHARTSGCPFDKFAGIFLHKKVGEKVKKGEKIATLYSTLESKLAITLNEFKNNNPFIIK